MAKQDKPLSLAKEATGLGSECVKDIPYYLPLSEAISFTLEHKLSCEIENIPLDDAHGRILAEDLRSKVNDPPFDNSAMDGFAVQYGDTEQAPSTLEIIAVSQAAAGDETLSITSGQAVRIMTGAPIPSGADAIIPIEACSINDHQVTLNQPSKPHFIRKCGENIRQDEVGLKKGTHLTPQAISMCATMGYATIPVIRRLKIGVISTGDELKPPGAELAYGEIYESNSYGISGLVKMLGHTPIRYPAVHDSIEALRNQFDVAAEECDLFITSGGVSMGEWDYVRKAHGGRRRSCILASKNTTRITSVVWPLEWDSDVWITRKSSEQPCGFSNARRSISTWLHRHHIPTRSNCPCPTSNQGSIYNRLPYLTACNPQIYTRGLYCKTTETPRFG